MYRGFLVMLVIACMVLFALPAFACTECGRDGPASFSHFIQDDTNTLLGFTVLAVSGGGTKVLAAGAAEWPTVNAPATTDAFRPSCTLAIVGYDTGDPTEAVLAKVNEKETCIRSDKGAAQINLNGGGVTFAYVG